MTFRIVTTVTVPATNYDLVDLDTVKDELSITGGASDARLKRYITAASAAAAQYCNRVFAVETVQDVIDLERDPFPWQVPGGTETLQASRWPILTLSSLVDDTDTLIDGTDFRSDLPKGLFYRLSPFIGSVVDWPAVPVTLIYQAGFATVPADVEDAVIRMVRSRWFAKGRDPMVREINVPGVLEQQFWIPTGTDAGAMTPDVTDILDNYRVPLAA